MITPNQTQTAGLLPQRLRTRGQEDPAKGLIGKKYGPACNSAYQNYNLTVVDAASTDASTLNASSSGNLILLLVDDTNNTNRLDQFSGVVNLQDGRGRTFKIGSASGDSQLVDEIHLSGTGNAVFVQPYQTERLLWVFPVPADVQAPLQLVSILAPDTCTKG